MSDEPSKPRRVVLRYQDSWDELRGQLHADRAAGLAPSGVRDAVAAWLDAGSMAETGTLVRRASSSYRGGDTLADLPTEVPADGLIAAWGRHHGAPVFVVADDPALGHTIPNGSVRGSAAAAKATRLRSHALEQARPLIQVLAAPRLEPDTFIGAEFVRFGFLVDLDECQATLDRILKLTIVTAALDEQASLEASASHLVVLVGPDSAVAGHGGADALARGLADVQVADLAAALELVGAALDHLPPSCFDPPPPSSAAVPAVAGAPSATTPSHGDLLDDGWSLELAAAWQPAVRTRLGHLGGHLIGVLAIDPATVWSAAASHKAQRLVHFCDAFRLPLVIHHTAVAANAAAAPATTTAGASAQADLDARLRLSHALATATTPLLEVADGTQSWLALVGVRPSWSLGVGVDLRIGADIGAGIGAGPAEPDDGAPGHIFDATLPTGSREVKATVAAALAALPVTRRRMDQDERIRRRQPRVMQSEN